MKRKRDELYNGFVRPVSGGVSFQRGKDFRIGFSKGNFTPFFSDTVL